MQKLSFALGILILPSAFHSVQAQTEETRIKTGAISGRVMVKGEPAKNILVYLHPHSSPAPSNPDAYLRARTDENGRFRIAGVAAGDYSIIPLAPGFVCYGGVEPSLLRKTLKAPAGGNVENVDIELYRGGVITGRVTDSRGQPLTEMQVQISRLEEDGRWIPSSSYGASLEMYVTDDRGVYRLYGLPVGRYLVSIGIPFSAGEVLNSRRGTFYPRTFHPKAANESKAKVIEITEGAEIDGVDIIAPESTPTRSISGRVINADTGQPVEGVKIVYNGKLDDAGYINYWRSGVISEANGEFSLKNMSPGKYALIASADGESEFFSKTVVSDSRDGDVNGVEIKVHRGGSLSGVVVIEGTNDPEALAKLPTLAIYVHVRSDQVNEPRRDNPKISDDGSFHIRGLPQGWAHIVHAPLTQSRGFSLARVEHNGAVVRDGIDVGPGKRVTGVRVVLVYNERQQ
jgi:Carboxypeptidase regulatory-like domain